MKPEINIMQDFFSSSQTASFAAAYYIIMLTEKIKYAFGSGQRNVKSMVRSIFFSELNAIKDLLLCFGSESLDSRDFVLSAS